MKRSSLVLATLAALACNPSSTASNGGGGGGGGGTTSTETPSGTGTARIGAACLDGGECASGKCVAEWPEGYCTEDGCAPGTCPDGAQCFDMPGGGTSCLTPCDAQTPCRAGYTCGGAGACIPSCKALRCPDGYTCEAKSLRCKTSDGAPPPEPTTICADLPPRDCTDTAEVCRELIRFDPEVTADYEDYPINGETATNQYRSYARRDLVMLMKWATAYVSCKAKGWAGNGGPSGLADMSQSDGSMPPTYHPAGTHERGLDIDLGYYQDGSRCSPSAPNNHLCAVCDHKDASGIEQRHCLAAPTTLDLWRSTLFLGAAVTSSRLRVMGVDGKIGPMVLAAMPKLCAMGLLEEAACTRIKSRLAFEEVDGGSGWFVDHYHHIHLSLSYR